MTSASFDAFKAFAEAAEAMQVKPQLEARIAELEAALASEHTHVTTLESTLNDSLAKANELNSKLSSLEVERDQYFFQATEAEDRLAKVAGLLGLEVKAEPSFVASAGQGNSPSPNASPAGPAFGGGRPEGEAKVVTAHSGYGIESTPQPVRYGFDEFEEKPSSSAYYNDEDGFSRPGVSVSPDPIASSTVPALETASNAEATASASPSGLTSKGFTSVLPYLGKPRWHKPQSLDLNEWLNGGGQ